MRNRYSVLLACCLGAVLASSTVFAAAKPAGQVEDITGQPLQHLNILGSQSAQATCSLGASGTPAFFFNYLLPPNDAYYTRIRSADCTACPGPGGVEVVAAHVFLNFRGLCNFPVRVAVVGTTGNPSCLEPDPTNILCPPVSYNLTVPAAGNYDFTLPLPAGCCVSGTAFIEITFLNNATGCSTSSTIPRLITTATCTPCLQYNIYPGGGDEWCSIGPPGDILMSADVNCCSIVPTVPKTWGQLRTRYGY